MATVDKMEIEVEITFYMIIKTNKKWWQFWKKNYERVLISTKTEAATTSEGKRE